MNTPKYQITKTDGTPVDPQAIYFVLRIDAHGTDKRRETLAARAALEYYAAEVEAIDPAAAADALALLDRVEDSFPHIEFKPGARGLADA